MMNNKISKLTVILSAMMMLLMLSSSVTANQQIIQNDLSKNSLVTSYGLEYATVIAGKGTATLNRIVVHGGSASFPAAISPSSNGFKTAVSWQVAYVNNSGYDTYLQRIPSSFPDGLSLALLYPITMTLSQAVDQANIAATALEAKYSVKMHLTYSVGLTAKGYVFMFAGGNDTIASSVLSDVKGIRTGGFSDLFNAISVTNKPFGFAYSVLNYGGDSYASTWGYFVSPNGIVNTGTSGEYKISVKSIFGSAPTPDTIRGLSRVRINIPYPITTVAISPAQTSNPLPQVTSEAFWDVRSFRSDYTLPTAPDYTYTFKVGMSKTFPMVENHLSINQTKLNTQGTLEANFNLTNIGSEVANNVKLSFPLGKDFNRIVNANMSMYRIRSGITLNSTFTTNFNISVSSTIAGISNSFNFNFLSLDGWYYNSSGKLADWNTTTSYSIYSKSITGADFSVSLLTPDGAPQGAISAVYNYIVPALNAVSITTATDFPKLRTALRDSLPSTLSATFNSSLAAYYDKIPIFKLLPVNFTAVQRTVGSVNPINMTFLEATVPSIAAGASVNLQLQITNIPSASDNLAYMKLVKGTTSAGGISFNKLTLQSSPRNYNELMQYIFALENFSGRPLSFYTDAIHNPLGASVDAFITMGVMFTWQDAQGFKFFGLSNGQNIQIADDEAVIGATVRFKDNKQVYNVGDPITFDVSVFNTGNAAASDVKVHLVHAKLGRNWKLTEFDRFYTKSLGTLNANSNTSFSYTVPSANTFVGYHPVFAVVEFTSEKGQVAPTTTDFFDRGVTSFPYGGQTKEFTVSTLIGALLLPPTISLNPAVPEARIKLSTSSSTPDTSGKFTFTITAKNIGNAATDHAIITQFLPLADFTVTASSASKGTLSISTVGTDTQVLLNTSFAVGESVTITLSLTLKTSSGYIPPALIEFMIEGQSSFGTVAKFGFSATFSATIGSLLSLNTEAAAQEQSQSSATGQGSSSAYSSGGAVFASTSKGGELTSSTVTSKPGVSFVSFGWTPILAVVLIPVVSLMKKRKLIKN